MREVKVIGLCVVNGVEIFEFVRNTFDVETALVPGIEDATYASLPRCVAKVASVVSGVLVKKTDTTAKYS